MKRSYKTTNDYALEIDTLSKLEEHDLLKSPRLKQKVKLVRIEILSNIKFQGPEAPGVSREDSIASKSTERPKLTFMVIVMFREP